MNEINIGDTLTSKEIEESRFGIHDWGAVIDGHYSYVMIDEDLSSLDGKPEEYVVVVDQYRVVEKKEID